MNFPPCSLFSFRNLRVACVGPAGGARKHREPFTLFTLYPVCSSNRIHSTAVALNLLTLSSTRLLHLYLCLSLSWPSRHGRLLFHPQGGGLSGSFWSSFVWCCVLSGAPWGGSSGPPLAPRSLSGSVSSLVRRQPLRPGSTSLAAGLDSPRTSGCWRSLSQRFSLNPRGHNGKCGLKGTAFRQLGFSRWKLCVQSVAPHPTDHSCSQATADSVSRTPFCLWVGDP